MNWILLLTLMLGHVLADGVFQSREMARRKAHHLPTLARHVAIIFLGALPALYLGPLAGFGAMATIAILHGLVDWTLWNVWGYWTYETKKLHIQTMIGGHVGRRWERQSEFWQRYEGQLKDDRVFFTCIVLDQALHHATLVVALLMWS